MEHKTVYMHFWTNKYIQQNLAHMGSRCKTVPYSKNPQLRLHNNNFTEAKLDLDENLEHHLRSICQKETFIRFIELHQRHTVILLLLQITKTSILCFLTNEREFFLYQNL